MCILMWFISLHCNPFHCASHRSSPGLREVKARLLWTYILDAVKCHFCPEEMSSGEDKAHVSVATVAVTVLQCKPETCETKGVCLLSLMHPHEWVGFPTWQQPRLLQCNEYAVILIQQTPVLLENPSFGVFCFTHSHTKHHSLLYSPSKRSLMQP